MRLHYFSCLFVGSKKRVTKRFEIAKKDSMPRLGDEPSIDIEDVSTTDVLPGSNGGLSQDDDVDDDDGVDSDSTTTTTTTIKRGSKTVKKQPKTRSKTVSAENAANFGNNVESKPGINPTAAFMVKEGNHKGFRGKDKSVTASKKSKTGRRADTTAKKNKKSNNKGSFHKGDTDIISKIKDIAKELNDVEAKKKKIKQQKAKNESKKKQTATDLKNILQDDLSTKNSHGRSQTSQQLLANQTQGMCMCSLLY